MNKIDLSAMLNVSSITKMRAVGNKDWPEKASWPEKENPAKQPRKEINLLADISWAG